MIGWAKEAEETHRLKGSPRGDTFQNDNKPESTSPPHASDFVFCDESSTNPYAKQPPYNPYILAQNNLAGVSENTTFVHERVKLDVDTGVTYQATPTENKKLSPVTIAIMFLCVLIVPIIYWLNNA